MDRNTQKIGLTNVAAFLVATVSILALAVHAESHAGRTSVFFLALGLFVTVVAYFQMRLEDREEQERLEVDEMARKSPASGIFGSGDSDILPAKRAREQFERFMVPGFTVLLVVLEGMGLWLLWDWLRPTFPVPIKDPLMTLALFAMFALGLFLLGKYSVGLARIHKDRLLRPMASFLLFGAYELFAVAGGLVAVQAGFERADLYVARVLAFLLVLLAMETVLGLILELYRPRVKGRQGRVLYESRIIGYLAQPEGIFTTAAHVLDYQFGFKVSETWVYKFFERALGWLILAQGAVLLVSSCFVFVEPTEEALLERLGKPVAGREVLDPGFHLKFPWPIDKLYRHHTEQIQEITVGVVSEEHGHEGEEGEPVLVWTIEHAKEEINMLVASREEMTAGESGLTEQSVPPVNFLVVSVPVQFKIRDLTAWVYNHVDAAALLENLAYRETVRYLVSVDLFDFMAEGRLRASQELQRRIQKASDDQKLGVDIVFVGLQNIHPPVQVAPAFENVVGAHQEIQTKILEAQAFQLKNVPLARAEATNTIRQAESHRLRMSVNAAAQANQFTNQLQSFLASPSVFKTRSYLQSLLEGGKKSRKYILSVTNAEDVLQIDLQDKLRPDLLDVPVEVRRPSESNQ